MTLKNNNNTKTHSCFAFVEKRKKKKQLANPELGIANCSGSGFTHLFTRTNFYTVILLTDTKLVDRE